MFCYRVSRLNWSTSPRQTPSIASEKSHSESPAVCLPGRLYLLGHGLLIKICVKTYVSPVFSSVHTCASYVGSNYAMHVRLNTPTVSHPEWYGSSSISVAEILTSELQLSQAESIPRGLCIGTSSTMPVPHQLRPITRFTRSELQSAVDAMQILLQSP